MKRHGPVVYKEKSGEAAEVCGSSGQRESCIVIAVANRIVESGSQVLPELFLRLALVPGDACRSVSQIKDLLKQ